MSASIRSACRRSLPARCCASSAPASPAGHLRPFPIKSTAIYPLEQAKGAFSCGGQFVARPSDPASLSDSARGRGAEADEEDDLFAPSLNCKRLSSQTRVQQIVLFSSGAWTDPYPTYEQHGNSILCEQYGRAGGSRGERRRRRHRHHRTGGCHRFRLWISRPVERVLPASAVCAAGGPMETAA